MMKSTIVGIDVGSVSIGLAEIDGEGAIVRTGYRIHLATWLNISVGLLGVALLLYLSFSS